MTSIIIFILCAGFIIGLGAVTVIDLHGFLARHSAYWTEATIRTHKVTKPLIWIGIALVLCGTLLSLGNGFISISDATIRLIIIGVLIMNGLFLSFIVSPALLQQEREGRAQELLPMTLQYKIIASFCVSLVGWWGLLLLTVSSLTYAF